MSDIAWAAGLFEGEGTFYTQVCTTRGVRYQYPRASMTMIDLDVLERFRNVVGVGKIKPRHSRQRTHPHRSLQYVWTADATSDVHHVAEVLGTWFGARRRAQVDRVLSAHRGRLPT